MRKNSTKESLKGEIWMPVDGLEGYYEVSNFGRVWSLPRVFIRRGKRGGPYKFRGRMRVLKKDRTGYYWSVALYKNGVRLDFDVHRLVLETFVGPCPEGMVCRHLDGNGKNNCIDNLRWGTPKENGEDRVRHGTNARPMNSGEGNYWAKLTNEKVLEIRRRFANGQSDRLLAVIFDVKVCTIRGIVKRQTWKHV